MAQTKHFVLSVELSGKMRSVVNKTGSSFPAFLAYKKSIEFSHRIAMVFIVRIVLGMFIFVLRMQIQSAFCK